VIFRSAVAIEAPGHALRLVLVNDLHFIDRAVTTVAAHATIHVNGVVEIGVVGHLVDAHPIDWFAGFPAIAHGGELRTIGLDLSVAGHTGLSCRHVGVRSHLDEAVAVSAIHTELLDVDDVGEGNWLVGLVTDSGVFRGKVIRETTGYRRDQRAGANDQLQGKPVCPFWKKIRH